VSFAEKLAADHEWVAKEPLAAGAMAAWTGCSEPWVYLATLRQFHEIFTWKTRTDTDVPNGRDASSSGLQLMGSLLRDEKSMAFTNVIPGDKPADLYAEVARHSQALLENEQWLKEQLEKRHKSAEKKAEKFGKPLKTENITFNLDPKEHVNRKTTKRAVMTDSYNASVRSKAEYVSEELMSLEAELGRKVTLAEKAIVTSAIIQGQAQAFPVCVIIKQFCKDIVLDVIGRQEKTAITWTTPCGSKLSQKYNKKQIKQIQTYAMGGTTIKHSKRSNSEVNGDAIWLTLQVDSDEIDGARHTSAFSPNLHHSYDAYISQQTILGMGDKPVGAIHDCWCGRAGETQELVDCAKRAFLKLVTSDVLERLVEANGAEVTVPRFGDDSLLDRAMESDFMFA
jgi:DNA-directed RNA polymerase